MDPLQRNYPCRRENIKNPKNSFGHGQGIPHMDILNAPVQWDCNRCNVTKVLKVSVSQAERKKGRKKKEKEGWSGKKKRSYLIKCTL